MKSFKVSNFRLFDEKGTEVHFRPVTILTGPNSSGKSSFVKAIRGYADYCNSVLNEFRRDGSFNPAKEVLDLYRPELKIKGFSSVKNKDAYADSLVSFTHSCATIASCCDNYQITHSFNTKKDGVLDVGSLESISISHNDELILRLSRNGDSFSTDYFNIGGSLLSDFLDYCRFYYLPYRLIKDSCDERDGSFDPEYYDDEGNFSIEKTAQTARGKILSKLQGLDQPGLGLWSYVDGLPNSIFSEYKNLYTRNLFAAIYKCVEFKIVFYFPVLEKFIGKDKESSINILQDEWECADFLVHYLGKPATDKIKEKVTTIINDFKKSEYDSFLDYYRSLENYVLKNVNKGMISFGRIGRSYNFIDDILDRIDVSFDSVGFNKRKQSETMFSLVYDVLSVWQWEEGEELEIGVFESDDSDSKRNVKDGDYIIRSYSRTYLDYSSRNVLFEAYKDFIRQFLNDCLISKDFYRLEYNTSSFASVQRLHSFEENSQFVETMKKYVSGLESLNNSKTDYVPNSFLNKWLGAEGLDICHHIELNTSKVEGLGFIVELVKENGEREQLADVGHGITQIVSILIQIESIILQNYSLKKQIASNGTKEVIAPAIIMLEEPEVSLHPMIQSFLADILQDAATNYGGDIQFIVETHSEYLVRKMQAIVSGFSKDEFEHNPFAVYYFNEDGTIKDLGFKESGRFKESFGPGFFDEAASLKYILVANEHNKNE